LCDGGSTIRELSRDIADAFGQDPAGVQRQVRALLREFRKAGFLNEAKATKPS